MFTAALFTISKTWKQPKCPSTEEEINMWSRNTKEYYLAIKKEWKNAISSNMDGSRDCHTKWSKSDKDKYIPHMCNLILKSDKMYLFTKQKELQILKTILQLLKGKYSEGGIKQELGMNLHTPLCIK